ncbi:hypothetical protein LTR53_019134, partial [Teratosphaeriaceae sp. CCFEE 6253]
PISLLDFDEPRMSHHEHLDTLHTAASSSSDLFVDCRRTFDRRTRARDAAMRILEGRNRATMLCPVPAREREVPHKVAEFWESYLEKPLPPEPVPGRNVAQRAPAVVKVEVKAKAPPLRISSGKIFQYFRRL